MTDMDTGEPALLALVVATALHTGFQLTVTTVVYPALARVDADRWAPAHAAHSRSIMPVVALSYAGLVGAGLWAVLSVPSSIWVWVAAGGALLAALSTALVAAPTHGALARGRHAELLRRLLRADRVRTFGAVLALAAAVAATLTAAQ